MIVAPAVCRSIFDNRWTNLTFQSSSDSVKQTASEDIALAPFFSCSPLSFLIDITHITLPMTDSRRGRRFTNKRSKHTCKFHISIYKQLLFTHFLLFFRCSSPLYMLVPSPHRLPRLLPRRAPPSIPTLSDRHWWLFFRPAGSLTVSVTLEKDHARKHARAW